MRMLTGTRSMWHEVARASIRVHPSTREGNMSATKRESWGSLRKLPSGRWQARYPGPDGETYTARTDDDKSLTFLTKTDARRWLAAVQTRISLGQWEPPAVVAARNRADGE